MTIERTFNEDVLLETSSAYIPTIETASDFDVVAASIASQPDGTERSTVSYGFYPGEGPNVPLRSAAPVVERRLVDEAVERWLLTASPEETMVVQGRTLRLGHAPLPRPSLDLLDQDPIAYLDLNIERTLDIERRMTDYEAEHAALRISIEEQGCYFRSGGMFGGFVVDASPACMRTLVEAPEVVRVEEVVQPTLLANTGIEIRTGHQVQQFLNNNLTGELGSGRSIFGNDMSIGFYDTVIDADHPAWADGPNSSNSRLKAIRCFVNATGAWNGSHCTPEGHWTPFYAAPGDTVYEVKRHGTWVAGQAVADLTDDQDGNQGNTWEGRRTGMTTESHFVFYGTDGEVPGFHNNPSRQEIVTRAIQDGLDILSISLGSPSTSCGDANSNSELFDVFHDGILVVAGSGNEGGGGGCTIGPGYASNGASLTVGALQKNGGELHSAPMRSSSSGGPDINGRHMVDLVAVDGREAGCTFCSGTMSVWNDAYGGAAWWIRGTSFSAPIVAGAAANLKHQMVNKLGASTINQPGRMHALMLLMGDRQTAVGKSNNAMDPYWGAGRMQMRKLNNAGMDEPWAFHSVKLKVADQKTYTFDVKGGLYSGFPIKVPDDADEFRLAAWWLETHWGAGTAADITIELVNFDTGATVLVADGSAPQHRRLFWSKIGGRRWYLRITGTDVPGQAADGTDPGSRSRDLHLAWFWEDSDRDDANGPAASIK